MCSPIRFTRPGARATRTGLVGEGGGGASNARANAAARGVEAMRVEFSLLYLQARAGVVILGERAERARAKDLLAVASRTRGTDAMDLLVAALAEQQILRACGAQDDRPACFANRKVRKTTLRCGTRASEGPACGRIAHER